jgi:hypothetical protein
MIELRADQSKLRRGEIHASVRPFHLHQVVDFIQSEFSRLRWLLTTFRTKAIVGGAMPTIGYASTRDQDLTIQREAR